MTFVEACRAWKTVTGSLPLDITILIEGEEEIGSKNFVPFLEANKAEAWSDLPVWVPPSGESAGFHLLVEKTLSEEPEGLLIADADGKVAGWTAARQSVKTASSLKTG